MGEIYRPKTVCCGEVEMEATRPLPFLVGLKSAFHIRRCYVNLTRTETILDSLNDWHRCGVCSLVPGLMQVRLLAVILHSLDGYIITKR